MYPGEPVLKIGFSYRPARLGIDELLKRFTNTGSVLKLNLLRELSGGTGGYFNSWSFGLFIY